MKKECIYYYEHFPKEATFSAFVCVVYVSVRHHLPRSVRHHLPRVWGATVTGSWHLIRVQTNPSKILEYPKMMELIPLTLSLMAMPKPVMTSGTNGFRPLVQKPQAGPLVQNPLNSGLTFTLSQRELVVVTSPALTKPTCMENSATTTYESAPKSRLRVFLSIL